MAWLRVDDSFVRHPKIAPLSDRHFRTWMRVLCWCAAYQNGGRFRAETIANEVVGADNRFIEICRKNRLLDVHENGDLQVHDWSDYNGRPLTPAERQSRWRSRQRRNGDVDGDVDGAVDEDVDGPRARAGTRARSPLSRRESDRATLSPRKDEQAIGDEGGDDAATSSGSAASSPPSPVLTGRPAEPRSATNLDTGTIVAGTLDWCLGECGKQYDLDELGAEGMCSSCRAKREEAS